MFVIGRMISKGIPRRGSEATKRGEGVGGGIQGVFCILGVQTKRSGAYF